MPTILFVILFRLVVTAVSAFRKPRTAKPNPLCVECSFAHVQYGACGRRAISCTFGGGVRVMKIDVLYCTDFAPRNVPARPAIGFVPNILAAD